MTIRSLGSFHKQSFYAGIAVSVATGAFFFFLREVKSLIFAGWNPKFFRKKLRLFTLSSVNYELSKRLNVASKLALKAGKNMRLIMYKKKNIELKGINDLVTDTDKENEKLIFNGLRKEFESDLFIGEESSSLKGSIDALTDDFTWIVDPIDGTTNFVHGFPMTCVSIGLTYKQQLILGIIYDPVRDELYQAVRGHGAWMNGNKICVSTQRQLSECLVLNEYGYERNEEAVDKMMKFTGAALKQCRGIRQTGSGAMDLAMIACGRVDVLFSGIAGEGWKPWDYAAGVLLIEEAGGVVLSLNGSPFNLFGSEILCCPSQNVANEIIHLLSSLC